MRTTPTVRASTAAPFLSTRRSLTAIHCRAVGLLQHYATAAMPWRRALRTRCEGPRWRRQQQQQHDPDADGAWAAGGGRCKRLV